MEINKRTGTLSQMAPLTTDSDSLAQRPEFVRLEICLSNICPGVANK